MGTLTSGGGLDALIAKVSPSGEAIWARLYGGELDQSLSGLAPRNDGNFLVGGTFEGDLDLGGGALQASAKNVFIGALGP